MGMRRMTDVEKRAATTMARARLVGGELPSSVVKGIKSWLMAAGWNQRPASTRAGAIVTELVEEIQNPPKRSKSPRSLYEAWRLPGSDWTEGEISATEAKAVGATIKIKGPAREFHVEYENRWGDDRFPWKLRENELVGTLGAEDNFVQLVEFSTMTAARAEAHRLARGGESAEGDERWGRKAVGGSEEPPSEGLVSWDAADMPGHFDGIVPGEREEGPTSNLRAPKGVDNAPSFEPAPPGRKARA